MRERRTAGHHASFDPPWTVVWPSSSTPTPAAAARRGCCPRPRPRCAASARRLPHRDARARSSTRASWRARPRDAGEIVVTLSGDGLVGAVAGRAARARRRGARRPARRARQRLRPRARHPARRRRRRPSRRWSPRARAPARPRPRRRAPVHRHRLAGLRLRRQPHRQRGAVAPRQPASTPTARCARSPRWRPARFDLELDGGERARRSPATRSAPGTTRPTAAGCTPRPMPSSTTALLDVVLCEAVPKRRFLTQVLPRVFKGTHVELPEVHVMRAREVRVERRPPVRRLRRRRPDRRAPGHARASSPAR